MYLRGAWPRNKRGPGPGDAFEVGQLSQQGGLVGEAPCLGQVLSLYGLVVGLCSRCGGVGRGCRAVWGKEAILPALQDQPLS